MAQRIKTVSRNFRFDALSAQALEFESERRGISLNALVNNVFRKYVEFDRLAERTNMVTLNRPLFSLLLSLAPNSALYDQVYDYGKQSGNDTLLFWKKEVSSIALKDYLTRVLCDFCNLGEYDLTLSSDTFVVTHNLGPRGTIFLKAYISGIIEGCMGRTAPIDASGSTLKFSLLSAAEN